MDVTDDQREYLAEYERLTGAYDPGRRLAECPDPDANELVTIEVDFAIPVLMTRDQQRRLLELIDEITDSPWNMPAEGVHWMAGVGTKMHWSRVDSAMLGKAPEPGAPFSGEPTYDDSVFHVETCARAFVSDKERDRVMKRRAEPKPARPARDAVLEALQAVAEFWGKDPEAFDDDATVTSLAGRFARVADKCRKAIAIVEAERMREE
jgi:hypothetical protein